MPLILIYFFPTAVHLSMSYKITKPIFCSSCKLKNTNKLYYFYFFAKISVFKKILGKLGSNFDLAKQNLLKKLNFLQLLLVYIKLNFVQLNLFDLPKSTSSFIRINSNILNTKFLEN